MIDSNLLALTGFKLFINSEDFKHTQYFAVSASFPSVSLAEVTTGYKNNQGFVPGDKLAYDPLTMRIAIDEKLESYRKQGYKLIGVSNQSGISKEIVTIEQVDEIFEKTRSLIGYTKEEFPILYCPHRAAPISCFCRKPQSGMAVDCIMKLQLNPKECIMVGDMTTDENMAKRLNIKYYDVKEFWAM